MVATASTAPAESEYDRRSELMSIDQSKSGIKGLVDAGLAKLPRVFVHDHLNFEIKTAPPLADVKIPLIDFAGVDVNTDCTQRAEIIDQMRSACEKWGFFQLVNHGIPVTILEEMITGIRRFNEQDPEAKEKLYSREESKKVTFNTKIDMSQALSAYWRDTLTCVMAPNPPAPEEIPEACRDILLDYTNNVLETRCDRSST
ncbi:hypothetical protein V6N13_070041 [Hibiscus sabdariffa]